MGLVVSDFNRSAVGHYNGLAEGKAKASPAARPRWLPAV